MDHTPKSLTVGMLLQPGVALSCVSAIADTFRIANELASASIFRCHFLSETREPVDASAGLTLVPEDLLGSIHKLDYLCVFSTPNTRFRNEINALSQLRKLHRHGTTLIGVSGGVFTLARAGLLDGRECSVHWSYREAFVEEFPNIVASDSLLIKDRRLLTAAGAISAINLALWIVKDKIGAAAMTEVACQIQLQTIADSSLTQTLPVFQSARLLREVCKPVLGAIGYFNENLSDCISIDDAAAVVAVSRRQLERLFKESTNVSPAKFLKLLRLKKATQMLKYTQQGLSEISSSVGYSNTSTFSNVFRQQYGLSPREYRQANMALIQNVDARELSQSPINQLLDLEIPPRA